VNNFPFRIFFLFLILFSAKANAALVEYELVISQSEITIESLTSEVGRIEEQKGIAMTVNGQFPAPVLHFTEGDQAKITVRNELDVDTSIHWHGLLVPADQDGVPYLSNFPIKPGETFVYQFPIKHAGTYWYHSHTDLQEQLGVHGGIVIEPKEARKKYDYEAVLVLQDWTHEDPKQVLANLKKDGDYYSLKKDSVISIAGYLKRRALKNWLEARWMRMGGMDISDVGYDAFLINGSKVQTLFPEAKAGEKVLLRVINAGTSSYFYLHSSPQLGMEVIEADGMPVQPFKQNKILHAMAETYDIVLTLPENKQYELRASAQDGAGYASVYFGSGELNAANKLPKPDLYASHMNHEAMKSNQNGETGVDNMSEMGEHHAHMNHGMKMEGEKEWDYRLLKSTEPTTLPDTENVREIELRLSGDMESYNWSFNDVPLSRADKIKIKKGEVIRFRFINETMMHHPLHLHGHFFRVLTGNGEYDPLKHTVNIKPLENKTIEFFANEEKDWFFHCHNLYHAKAGMARVVSYEQQIPDEKKEALMEAAKQSKDIRDNNFYYKGNVKILDDYFGGSITVSNNRHSLGGMLESFGYEIDKGEWEYQYSYNRWLKPTVIGERLEGHDDLLVGFFYTFPLLIDVGVFYTGHEETVLRAETEFQLTKRIQSHIEYSSEDERHYGLEYRFNEQLSAEVAYINYVRYVGGINYRF